MEISDIIKTLGYSFVVEQIAEHEGSGYNLYIPILGRYSCRAFGGSISEAYQNLQVVLEYIVKQYQAKGIELPAPNETKEVEQEFSGRMVLRMPKDTHKRLYLEAKTNKISLNQYLVSLIERNNAYEEVKRILSQNIIELHSKQSYSTETQLFKTNEHSSDYNT